jgi:hypothetical protein
VSWQYELLEHKTKGWNEILKDGIKKDAAILENTRGELDVR